MWCRQFLKKENQFNVSRNNSNGDVKMTDLNVYSLDLSSEEMNVLQVAIDHMVEHLADLHIEHPSDRNVHRRLDAVYRLKQWCNREVTI